MVVLTLLFAALFLIASPTARADDATTVRIETRAFYGATVTIEQGVRVFRPLPPHSKVIINPGGRTPLHVGLEEHRSTTHNNYYDHGAPDRVDPDARHHGGGFYPGAYNRYGDGPRFGRPSHFHHRDGSHRPGNAGGGHRGGGRH